MRCVLDASVAVASERAGEPRHHASRALVDRVLRGEDEIAVPSIFAIEVVAALGRRGHDAGAARRFVSALLEPPTRVVTIGPKVADRIARLAGTLRLRAADACYVWVASRQEAPLVTLDDEILRRSPGVDVRAP